MSHKIPILLFMMHIPFWGVCQYVERTKTLKSNFSNKFSVPKVIDTLLESQTLKKATSVTVSRPHIECLSPFTDTLVLAKCLYNPWDTSINRLGDQRADGLQLLVDTTQIVTLRQDKNYDGNEVVDTSSYNKGFPCFIFNETASIKWLYTQDSKVIVIQEALDTNHTWLPIQIWKWSWCGNSYYRVPLKPSSFAFFKIPLFDGGYYTKIRLKLYSSDAVYYSNEFNGWINYKQFNLPKKLMGRKGKPGFNLSFLTSEKKTVNNKNISKSWKGRSLFPSFC